MTKNYQDLKWPADLVSCRRNIYGLSRVMPNEQPQTLTQPLNGFGYRVAVRAQLDLPDFF